MTDPGAEDIIGSGTSTTNLGGTFAVQSLWSNQAAAGTGYCAGAGNDLPQPIPAQ